MNNVEIHVPTNNNELLEKALEEINNNIELKTLWRVNNVNAIERLGMTDHGPVHFQIVANVGLRLARLLHGSEVEMSITKNYELDYKYAELVILLACLYHDIGISIHRNSHEEYSLFLANDLLRESLKFLDDEQRTIVKSEVLNAIIGHRSDGKPLTLEGGIVRVSDALDMSEGRSRIPYEKDDTTIHTISAQAIDNIEIYKGDPRPIQVDVYMNNSSGIFQVDELLKKKLKGSGLEKYVNIKAILTGETEKRILKEYRIEL